MRNWWLLAVMGMAAVTFIPRLLPMVLMRDLNMPRRVRTFLEFVPAAALGALIFPGILASTGNQTTALVGGGVAVILAYFRLNVLIVVAGAVAAVLVMNII